MSKSLNIAKLQQIQALMAELSPEEKKALTSVRTGKIKVSSKGAISVYGLGRFPVTLYKSQMEKFLDMSDEIRKFMADNAELLTTKGE